MSRASQFDIYKTSNGVLIIILQSDLHDGMPTRVVAPLLQWSQAEAYRHLTPKITVDGADYMVATHTLATLHLNELGTFIVSQPEMRDDLIRAMDMLISGI